MTDDKALIDEMADRLLEGLDLQDQADLERARLRLQAFDDQAGASEAASRARIEAGASPSAEWPRLRDALVRSDAVAVALTRMLGDPGPHLWADLDRRAADRRRIDIAAGLG